MQQLKFILFLIVLFLATAIFSAEEVKENKPQEKELDAETIYQERIYISKEYEKGSNLIFDCKGRFWACVNERSKIKCEEARKEGLKYRLSQQLPCAPLKSFKDHNECLKSQYEMMHQRRDRSFCLLSKSLGR